MRISTQCSIALHCLIFIAEYEHTIKVTGERLAKSTGCNAVIIRNILNSLKKAEIITITRGAGGAHLNASPKEITVWDVYHAIESEGLEHLIAFHPHPSDKCSVGQRIETVLLGPYQEIGAAVAEAMKKITLQQLLTCYHEL